MDVVKKIDRPAIDTTVEAVMELVCDRCHYCYTEPTDEEVLTSECSACEGCPIEGKVRELVSLVEREVSVAFAHAIADTLKPILSGGALS